MKVLKFLWACLAAMTFVLWTLNRSLVVIVAIFRRIPKAEVDKKIELWCRITLKLFRVEVIESGRENLRPGGCLFLFNHCSFLDIFILQAKVPELRFGAKIELFSIPFFGRAMELAGVLPIARAKREKVFAVYERAIDRVKKEGQQFALSPEGGRNQEEKLLPFKSGPFIFAIQAGMPVAPVVIHGAAEVWPKHGIIPNHPFTRAKVYVHFLPQIETSEYTLENRGELQKVVFEQMQAGLASIQNSPVRDNVRS